MAGKEHGRSRPILIDVLNNEHRSASGAGAAGAAQAVKERSLLPTDDHVETAMIVKRLLEGSFTDADTHRLFLVHDSFSHTLEFSHASGVKPQHFRVQRLPILQPFTREA